jgi:hypothetical protein
MTRRPYRVAVHGLPHFCRKLSTLLDDADWRVPYRSPFHPVGLSARLYDLVRADLAYSWTGRINMGYFLQAARKLGKSKIIMLWCGSDALYAKRELAAGKVDPWVVERVHWAVSPWLAEEVRALGVDCEYVQVSFVKPSTPPPMPDKFSVLAYLPTIPRAELYGLDRIIAAARRLPRIEFHLVGLDKGTIPAHSPNLRVHGRVDLAGFFAKSTVLWRPVRHDGLSFMVLEALAAGRHVLYSQPLPACVQVSDVTGACREIERLRDLHESRSLDLNRPGIKLIAEEYDPKVVRENLLARWENMILSRGAARDQQETRAAS